MRLEHEFTYHTAVVGPHVVGHGPYGTRHVYEVREGVAEGPRLSARSLGPGTDWMLVGSDGFLRMNVRAQLVTDDGAIICVRYRGAAEANERLYAALTSGEATRFDEQRIRTVWQLESGDERYSWINQAVFVGEARLQPTDSGARGFEHRVCRLA